MNKLVVKEEELNIKESKTFYLDNSVKKINVEANVELYCYIIDKSMDLTINLLAEESSIDMHLNTINYNDNKISIKVNHLAKKTSSELTCHGVNVYDKKLDFNIEGKVNKDMDKSICNQSNTIININNGKSTILPILLIDNYDVISNHSAYIGKFKDEQIFYLMSRGLSKKASYELLINAFLYNENVDKNEIKDFIYEIKKI